MTRSLGAHVLKGREEPVDLCEILWRGETAQLTTLAPKLAETPRSSLELRLGDQVVRTKSDSREWIIPGRSAECSCAKGAGRIFLEYMEGRREARESRGCERSDRREQEHAPVERQVEADADLIVIGSLI